MKKSRGSGPQAPEPVFLNLARVLRPWGVRGDMKVELLVSSADDLVRAKRVYVGERRRPFDVQSVRFHSGSILIKLAGCESPEEAEAFRDEIFSIARSEAAPLRPNQFYHHQLFGLTALTVEGEILGRVTEIIEAPAHDVYVVTGPRGEILVPARAEFVKRIDLEAGQMTVTLLPGLLPE